MSRIPQSPEKVLAQVGPAVVYVETVDGEGKTGIGTAFHIGDGYFVTARHVVEKNKIKKVGREDITKQVQPDGMGGTFTTTTWPEAVSTAVEGPWYHPNEKIDVALFRCREIAAPVIQLELRSEVLAYNQFLLTRVLVLGFPPIPFAKEPHLVCVPTVVSAVIEPYHVGRRHFILTAMARGGFSGGVALSLEYATATLGVVTQSLGKDDEPTELGYLSVLSAELVVELLEKNGISVDAVKKTMAGFIVRT